MQCSTRTHLRSTVPIVVHCPGRYAILRTDKYASFPCSIVTHQASMAVHTLLTIQTESSAVHRCVRNITDRCTEYGAITYVFVITIDIRS